MKFHPMLTACGQRNFGILPTAQHVTIKETQLSNDKTIITTGGDRSCTVMKRTAVITGASKGIGLAIAQLFLERGFLVIACSRSGKFPPDFTGKTFACDVSQTSHVDEFLKFCLTQCNQIDILINNAGIAGANSMVADANDLAWQNILSTNLDGVYNCCKKMLPYLPTQSGRIINIASVLSHFGAADQTAYTAAKHGVLGFTRALAKHLAAGGITVNCICPGWTKTDMAEQRRKELRTTEAELLRQVPMGRWVMPQEIAELAWFLSTDAARNITGQAINICGGVTA